MRTRDVEAAISSTVSASTPIASASTVSASTNKKRDNDSWPEQYEICHLLQSKRANKDTKVAKTTERRKNKSKQTKDIEDKIISTLNRLICPQKTQWHPLIDYPICFHDVRALSGRTYVQRIPACRGNSCDSHYWSYNRGYLEIMSQTFHSFNIPSRSTSTTASANAVTSDFADAVADASAV